MTQGSIALFSGCHFMNTRGNSIEMSIVFSCIFVFNTTTITHKLSTFNLLFFLLKMRFHLLKLQSIKHGSMHNYFIYHLRRTRKEFKWKMPIFRNQSHMYDGCLFVSSEIRLIFLNSMTFLYRAKKKGISTIKSHVPHILDEST